MDTRDPKFIQLFHQYMAATFGAGLELSPSRPQNGDVQYQRIESGGWMMLTYNEGAWKWNGKVFYPGRSSRLHLLPPVPPSLRFEHLSTIR